MSLDYGLGTIDRNYFAVVTLDAFWSSVSCFGTHLALTFSYLVYRVKFDVPRFTNATLISNLLQCYFAIFVDKTLNTLALLSLNYET